MSTLRDRDPIEPWLRPWLVEEGMVREPDDLMERVAAGTRGVGQRPGWLVRLMGNGMAGAGAGPAARWREHRMATAVGLASIVLAATLIIPGLVGPNTAPAAPASPAPSATPAPGPDATFTGDLLSLNQDDSTVEETDHGVRGLQETYTFRFSDPRLPSTGRGVVNIDVYDTGMATSGVRLLEGPEGYWTGPFTSYCARAATITCRGVAVLTGHGAYEGLTAVIANSPPEDAAQPGVIEVWNGLIFPAGEMPPTPEPLEPSAE